MNIKCPYCDNISPLSQWKVFVDEACYFFEDRAICKKICTFATCPICNEDVSLSSDGDIELGFNDQGILQNPEDIKNAIEGKKEYIDDKVVYCPYCREWKRFYEFTFIGNLLTTPRY